jgi:hypothetical protein
MDEWQAILAGPALKATKIGGFPGLFRAPKLVDKWRPRAYIYGMDD